MTTEVKRVKELFREWDNLVKPLTTPIVYHPGGWEDVVPKELKEEVLRQRLEKLNNGGWKEATDAEVLCYLQTASMVQPFDSDWTQILLYEASLFMPQLRDVVPDTPKELNQYQRSELQDLKRRIRASQLRNRKNHLKEVDMADRKLVMEEHGGKTLVGISKEGCDPVVKTVEGDIFAGLAAVNGLLAEAEEKWATAPKNPAYKAPPEPKKEAPAGAAAATQAEKAEDLPLLSGTGESKPAESGIETTESGTEAAEKGTEAPATEPPAPAPEPEPAATAEEPAAEPSATEEEAEAGTEEEATEPGAAAPTEAEEGAAPAPQPEPEPEPEEEKPAEQTPAATVPTGQVEYVLKDGRGPYADIQAAMDAMGMDETNRPHHNRWDRLSTSLKEQIQRRPKA